MCEKYEKGCTTLPYSPLKTAKTTKEAEASFVV
jgi:hypothetical protein